jgi:hypothetical protein
MQCAEYWDGICVDNGIAMHQQNLLHNLSKAWLKLPFPPPKHQQFTKLRQTTHTFSVADMSLLHLSCECMIPQYQ